VTAGDAELAEMVRGLAAMPAPDRAFVLARLSQSEMQLLTPYLQRAEIRPLSPALRELAADCGDERTADGLAPRAAAAVRTATASATLTVRDSRRPSAAQPAALRDRAAAFLAGR
jgi:hypothetical protein